MAIWREQPTGSGSTQGTRQALARGWPRINSKAMNSKAVGTDNPAFPAAGTPASASAKRLSEPCSVGVEQYEKPSSYQRSKRARQHHQNERLRRHHTTPRSINQRHEHEPLCLRIRAAVAPRSPKRRALLILSDTHSARIAIDMFRSEVISHLRTPPKSCRSTSAL